MFWKKKAIPKRKPISKEDQKLIKPSATPRGRQEKEIELNLACYLYNPKTDRFIEGTTITISKTTAYVKCLHELKTGSEVIILISGKRNLSKLAVKSDKNALKGRIERVEKDGIIYRILVYVTLGSINPFAYLGEIPENDAWWSRHWQGLK